MKKKFRPLLLTLLAVTLWATAAPANNIFFVPQMLPLPMSLEGFAASDAANPAAVGQAGGCEVNHGLGHRHWGNSCYQAPFCADIFWYMDETFFKRQGFRSEYRTNKPLSADDFSNNPSVSTSMGGQQEFAPTGAPPPEVLVEADNYGYSLKQVTGTVLLLVSGLLGLMILGRRIRA